MKPASNSNCLIDETDARCRRAEVHLDTFGLFEMCPESDSFCSAGEVMLVSPSPQCPPCEQNCVEVFVCHPGKNSTAPQFLKRIRKH
jgi:hypothetical protein